MADGRDETLRRIELEIILFGAKEPLDGCEAFVEGAAGIEWVALVAAARSVRVDEDLGSL